MACPLLFLFWLRCARSSTEKEEMFGVHFHLRNWLLIGSDGRTRHPRLPKSLSLLEVLQDTSKENRRSQFLLLLLPKHFYITYHNQVLRKLMMITTMRGEKKRSFLCVVEREEAAYFSTVLLSFCFWKSPKKFFLLLLPHLQSIFKASSSWPMGENFFVFQQ